MRLAALLLLFCCSFTADKNPEKCYRKFRQWYGDNHEQLVQAQTLNGLSFELRYLPNEVTIYQQVFQQKTVSRKQLKALYGEHDQYDTYNFRIASPEGGNLLIAYSEDKADFQEKQFYLIESIAEDFRLIRNNDTLRPVFCNFENNYGTAPFVLLHMAFEKAPKGSTIQQSRLLYTDRLFIADTVVFDCQQFMHLQIPKIQ